ncbi:MAG: V-type ATP synthase subunit K [Candidatus Hydrogenedentes bacterium]|nr:V-type ATP synthase subunit K [Candidatus Hydrogenedentota bacterium]
MEAVDPGSFQYTIEIARTLAFVGAALAFGLGGCGSAKGIYIASQQAAGVLSEKPDLFGQLLVMVALPGTQGFYGFIIAVMIAMQTGLMNGVVNITLSTGIALFFIGAIAGTVQYVSAIFQGQASAAGIALVGRRPDKAGQALLFPALVETYAVVALLAAILFILWLNNPGTAEAPSNLFDFIGGAKLPAQP